METCSRGFKCAFEHTTNGDPLIFDAPNEFIVGAADIENNSGNASSDTRQKQPPDSA